MRGALFPAAVCALLHAAAADPPLGLSVLSWNIHWQCGSDHHMPGCREAATAKVVALAKSHSVGMVVAVELEHNDSSPIDLPSHGLVTESYPSWVQINGSCPGAGTAPGDTLALAFDRAKGWNPVKSYGGCLGGANGGPDPWDKADARAFVVALLKAPTPGVAGCEAGICVIALHSPHVKITEGADKVAEVCGEARHSCTVAVGDWNAPISKQTFCNYTVADRWGQLLGEPPSGAAKLVGAPDENTCCFPETKYQGWDDHAVTNILGATVIATVLEYQMSSFRLLVVASNDTEEHKPIVATVSLPTPCAGNTTDPNVCAPERYGDPMCYNKQTDSCCENEVHGTAILCPVGGTGGCCIGGARASRIGFCCNETTTCCSGSYYETPGACCGEGASCCAGMGECCDAGTTCCFAPISMGADQAPIGTCCGAGSTCCASTESSLSYRDAKCCEAGKTCNNKDPNKPITCE